MRNARHFLFFLLVFYPVSLFAAAENTGLKLNGAVDLVGSFGAKNQTQYPRKLEVREAEFGVYGPIDHTFEGTLFFAAHNESGQYSLEVHEANFSSGELIPFTRLKVGKFFLGVGRLNQYHRHDWPFLNTPKSHELYFDEEAASDTGLQSSTILPFMPIFTEVTLGLTSGWTFGHSHSQGSKPLTPTHYTRLASYFNVSDSFGLQLGGNYLGRNSKVDGKLTLFGLDIVAKQKVNGVSNWLIQSEIWGRNQRPNQGALERSFGGYFYLQKQVLNNLFAGLRLDGYSLDTSPEKNLDYSIVPTVVFKNSEFWSAKAAYQWDYEKRAHKDSQVNRVVQVQFTFLLGDHPSHDF